MIKFAQFMRDLREATMELLMQGLSIEEVVLVIMTKMKDTMLMIFLITMFNVEHDFAVNLCLLTTKNCLPADQVLTVW